MNAASRNASSGATRPAARSRRTSIARASFFGSGVPSSASTGAAGGSAGAAGIG